MKHDRNPVSPEPVSASSPSGMSISRFLHVRGLPGGVNLATAEGGPATAAGILAADDGRRYAIDTQLATGSISMIVQARDLNCRRAVAMKVILTERRQEPAAIRRFIEEAQITAQLEHPNIVPVHEVGVDAGGRLFYTMKLVHGVSLQRLLDDLAAHAPTAMARYPLQRLLEIFQKVCDAVAFAHAKGVLHRDLTPGNIMVGEFGDVQLMDWGRAQVMPPPAGADAERTRVKAAPRVISPTGPVPTAAGAEPAGEMDGTPAYMAPELLCPGTAEGDARTDIYALGAVLYHILTLRPPVEGKRPEQILARVVRGDIRPPAALNPLLLKMRRGSVRGLPHLPRGQVPEVLSAVVMRAMAQAPAARYATVTELRQELEAWRRGFATRAEAAGAATQLRLLLRRQLRLVALAGVVLVLLLMAGGLAYHRFARERDSARAAAQLAQANSRRAESARHRLQELSTTAADQCRTLAARAMANRDWLSASRRLEAALKLAPDESALWHDQGRLLFSAAAFGEAAAAFANAEKFAPLSGTRNAAAAYRKLADELAHFLQSNARDKVLAAAAKAVAERFYDQVVAARLYEAIRAPADQPELQQRIADARLQAAIAGLLTANPKLERTDIDMHNEEDGSVRISCHSPNLVGLEPLRGCPISGLNLEHSGIRDASLEALEGMPLREIRVAGTAVRSLAAIIKGRPLHSFSAERFSELPLLAGLPLEYLSLPAMPLADLQPLAGMKLKVLLLPWAGAVSDLSVLHGMPLEELNLTGTRVKNLAPLRGAPVQQLALGYCPVTDFAVLAALPLTVLDLRNTAFADLALLKGKALTVLRLSRTQVRDLRPLADMPLRELNLIECPGGIDVSPLAGLDTLEVLGLPAQCKGLKGLRGLPKLRSITDKPSWYGTVPAAEFWQAHDAARDKGQP